MLQKFVCENCGKEYEVDPLLGTWQKDDTQQAGTCVGVSCKKFCCYKCGKESRSKKIAEIWNNKSKDEIKAIAEKRVASAKPRICKACGKEFIPDQIGGSRTNVYLCSEECRHKHYKKIPKTGTRRCQNCGKEYTYIENQGNWNKNNELVHIQGVGHEFVAKSQRFCCYECGVAYKERKRKVTNIIKYGRTSPFQDPEFRDSMVNKLKEEGKLFTSKGEIELKNWLESIGFKTEKFISGNGLKEGSPRMEIDIYIPEKKIGIEYNGIYFHSMNGKKKDRMTKSYHYNKSKWAKDNDIELIHIWEDQWINQKDIVKDIIKSRLGVVDENPIFARKCKIKEISPKEYKQFCIKNHIQGYKKATIKLGLFYNDELVQIASFNKVTNMGKASSKNTEYDFEWVRGCCASNNKVIGGTTKLYKHFIKTYKPNKVLCYADWNLFNGRGYRECGFELNGYTGPDKFYVTNDHKYTRVNRNPHKYKELMDLVSKEKLWLCYGAGSQRFIWTNEIVNE